MQRRHVLLGVGAAASGSALIGTGAFSRVESHRDVTIEVAEDPDAYLGMSGTGSANSDNYVSIDDNGHLAIDISDSGNDGHGVNSDSYTWFDSMIQVCNQGKEEVGFYIETLEDDDFPDGIDATEDDEPRLQFYTGTAAGSQGDDGTSSVMGLSNATAIPVGECVELGVRTYTKGIDATAEDTLFGDDVTVVADVDTDGDVSVDVPIRNISQGISYTDIEQAVAEAEEDDTIEVLTGSTFELDDRLNFTDGQDGVELVATSNSKPVLELEDDGSDKVIDIEAERVTIDGFRIERKVTEERESDGQFYHGIAIRRSGVTVKNNTVVGNAEDRNNKGIQVLDGRGSEGGDEDVEDVEITSNEVTGFAGGVSVASVYGGSIDHVEVDGNDLFGNGVTIESTGEFQPAFDSAESEFGSGFNAAAVDAEQFANVSVTNNTFRGNPVAIDLLDEDDEEGLDDIQDDVTVEQNTYVVEDGDSIQETVDEAREGETVEAREGTYEEDVTVDKDLTLEGPNAGIPAYDDGRSDPAVVVGQVDLSADGVAFDGFDVSPDDPATGSIDNEAVLVTASDVDVLNTAVTDFGESFDEGDFVDTIGIVVSAADELTDVTISGNEVTDIRATHPDDGLHGAVGISIAGDADAVVEDNVVSDIGTDTASYAWGIVARSTSGETPSNVEILDNVIESITSDPDSDFNENDLFGVGFGADDDVDASNVVANGNAIDTPELLGENKDGSNKLDATGNWWGEEDGPDEDRLVGEFDTSNFLTSPPS